MDNSYLNQFSTPFKRVQNQSKLDKIGSTHFSSTYKRIPIFSNHKRRMSHKKNELDGCCNKTSEPLYQNSISSLQVINFDFCGCEDSVVPCQIIKQSFLKNIPLTRMKALFIEQAAQSQLKFVDKKSLFAILPYNYPQVYLTHLDHLIKLLNIKNTNQFQCLFSIQYHCKIEYITYFMYKDMKSSFLNLSKFLQELDCQLIKYNTDINKLNTLYNSKNLTQSLDEFISDYYQSIGAHLIPITYYSKFMAQLYSKGQKYLVRLIAKFIVMRRKQLQEGLMYLRCAQLERYRNFMRNLNFQEFIYQQK